MLLSSLSDPNEILRGLECGADNFIPKPYDDDDLVQRIGELLGANEDLRHTSPSRSTCRTFCYESATP